MRFWAEQRKATASDNEDDENDEAVEPAELSEEEIARRQEAEEVRNAWAKLEEIENHARESREEFIKTLTVKQKDSRKALDWMMISLAAGFIEDALASLMPDETPDDEDESTYYLKWTCEQVRTNPMLYAQIMNKTFFDDQRCVKNGWIRDEKPEYRRNSAMSTGYDWLEDFGYPISDEERDYLYGRLDCYGEAEDE